MPVLSYTYDRTDGKYNILVLMVQYSKNELIKYDGYHLVVEKTRDYAVQGNYQTGLVLLHHNMVEEFENVIRISSTSRHVKIGIDFQDFFIEYF